MDERGVDERWIRCVGVDVVLKIVERGSHVIDIWRNVARIFEAAAGGADPVLTAAKFAGIFFFAAHALHEHGVGFTQQAVAERELLHTLKGKLCRTHIIDDFASVEIGGGIKLRIKDILQRALRAFNLRGKQRFLAHIHGDEKIGAGNEQREALEIGQRTAGGDEHLAHVAIKGERWFRRQRRRAERPVRRIAGEILYEGSGAFCHCEHSFHFEILLPF